MDERLRLIVDATTGTAEASFARLTGAARDTARSSDTAAASVAAAADAVAQARLKEADAAGRLTVAEAKLEEVRARYGEGSSQLVAAQERVASASRQMQAASANTRNALEQQEAAQRQATDAAEDNVAASEEAGRGTQRFRDEVGGLRDTVVGLVAGVSLADWVSDSVRGFLDGARGASALAQSMNATVAEGGKFLAVASSLGLEMDDLLEIQAEFAGQVQADADLLGSFGAQLVKNADGTTNWALTLQNALAALQKVPDATQRNALGFKVFGEEGYKQMSRLLLSGKSVNEVFAAMNGPDEDDVETTRRFDEAMAGLALAAGGAGRELGSVLVPVLTVIAQGVGLLVDGVSAVPGPMAVATAAAVLLGFANRATAESGGLLAASLAAVQGAAARATGAMSSAAAGATGLAAAKAVAARASSGAAAVLGGPLGVALLAVAGGYTLLNAVLGDNTADSEDAKQAQEALTSALQESGGVITDTVRKKAALSAQESGLLEVAKKAGVAQGDVTDALLGNEAAYDRVIAALTRYRDENSRENNRGFTELNAQGEAADEVIGVLEQLAGQNAATAESQAALAGELQQTTDKAALAQAAMDALTAALEGGTAGTAELSRLAGEAAAAQDAEAAATDRAKAAIEAHNAVTRDAVAATRERIDAVYAAESADFRFLQALDAAKVATDDGTTSVNEQRQAQVELLEAALSAADATADAAIESREAIGQVLTDVDRANIRAAEVIADLRARLNTPGLSQGARDEMQALIDQLVIAQDNGDIEAVLRLTGAQETASEIDEASEDRDTTVRVESRNGPAVVAYLDGIANAPRLALIRVESRNGPAVDTYLDGLSVGRDRLALIRVESRNGPAVDTYLDGLADQERLAIIRVESRNGPAVKAYLDGLAGSRTARIDVARTGAPAPAVSALRGAPAVGTVAAAAYGSVSIGQLIVQPQVDGGGRLTAASAAEAGRQYVSAIRAYESRNGPGWRTSPSR